MFTAIATAERPGHLLGEVRGDLTLKVRSPEHRGRVLRLRSPKCTIGSHPSCALRLRSRGVRPFHCVVLRGRDGTFVRRWSGDTCLNGAGFNDARLQPGDCLNIGPIELEVLECFTGQDAASPDLPSSDRERRQPTPEKEPPRETEICQQCQKTRNELTTFRQQLVSAHQQHESTRQAYDSTRQQLESVRQQLGETSSRLQSAEDQTAQLQSQLQQAQDRLRDSATADQQVGEQTRQHNEQLQATISQHESELQQWHERRQQWDQSQQQLETQLQQLEEQQHEAKENLRAATEDLERARNRSTELEQELDHCKQQLSEKARMDETSRREREATEKEVTNWRDLAESTRAELQREREEHQRVRNEWHVERESLQGELAQRSTSLDELQSKLKRETKQAESMIRSLQQEVEELLAQLAEAKQSVRFQGKLTDPDQDSVDLAPDAPSVSDETMLMAEPPAVSPGPTEGPLHVSEGASSSATELLSSDEPSEPTYVDQADMVRSELADALQSDRATSEVGLQPGHETEQPTNVMQNGASAGDTQQLDAASNGGGVPMTSDRPTEAIGQEMPGTDVSSPETGNATEVSDPADEEGVIQRYMERLLKRVSSNSDGRVTTTVEPLPSSSLAASTPVDTPVDDQPVISEEADDTQCEPKPVPSPAEPDDVLDSQSTDDHCDPSPLPRRLTEMASELLAMRELANDSTRDAIQRSDRRRLITMALGDLTAATVCFVFGGLLVAMNQMQLTLASVGGCLGLALGSLILLRGGYKYFLCRRIKSKMRAPHQDPPQ